MVRVECILYKGSIGGICQIVTNPHEIDGMVLVFADFIQKWP